MWHCPHCGAPQAETARCWVCHRSSTTCSTCRHFRTSLAADVGYCAKDRWRTPLTGLELRACWEEGRRSATTAPASPGGGASFEGDGVERRSAASVRGGGPLDGADPMRLRGFVPVEELAAVPPAAQERGGTGQGRVGPKRSKRTRQPALRPDRADEWEMRVSLFGEIEA